MSDQELKPCPFCGKEASVYVFDATGPYDRNIKYEYQPGCETDGCSGEWGGSSYSSDDEARNAWNTRTPDPMLEELAGALEEIAICLFHGLQDCRASIIAKDMLGKYQQSKV